MSNRIVITENIRVSGDVVASIPVGTQTWTTTGSGRFGATIELGGTPTDLPMPTEFSSLGLGVFRNRSTTKTIMLGMVEDPVYGSSLEVFAEIPPGIAAIVPLRRDITSLFAYCSDGVAALLDYEIFER